MDQETATRFEALVVDTLESHQELLVLTREILGDYHERLTEQAEEIQELKEALREANGR